LLIKVRPNDFGEVDLHEVKRLVECTEMIFIFVLVWSLGGNLLQESRGIFSNFIMKHVEAFNLQNYDGKELPTCNDTRT